MLKRCVAQCSFNEYLAKPSLGSERYTCENLNFNIGMVSHVPLNHIKPYYVHWRVNGCMRGHCKVLWCHCKGAGQH